MDTYQIPVFEDFVVNLMASPIATNDEQQKQYVDSDIIDDINRVAGLGGEVEINSENKTIYIQRANGTEYTLTGTDFDELIGDVPHGVDPKNYLLWLSQQW